MQFAFSRAYRFECKKCGMCCHARALSLTEAEYNKFTRNLDQANYESIGRFYLTPAMDMQMHDVGFKGKDCPFLTRKNETRLCKIYDSRYLVCRLSPLTISALPSGELLVGLMHCNGVSIETGEPVDEQFVKKVLDSMNDADPSFLKDFVAELQLFHENPLRFYTDNDLTDFWTKREFISRISRWLLNKALRDKPLDIRIKAIEELLNTELSMKLQMLSEELRLHPPLLLIPKDVQKLTEEIERGLDKKLETMCEDVELNKQTEHLKVLSRRKAEILVEGNPKEFGLDEKMPFFTPYLDRIEVKIEDLFREKPMSSEAIRLFEDYLAEILSRVDHGGFPADVPIIDVVESLYRLSQGILSHAKAYSQESGTIEKGHIKDAIIYLDTRYALQSILKGVMQEYRQSRYRMDEGSVNS